MSIRDTVKSQTGFTFIEFILATLLICITVGFLFTGCTARIREALIEESQGNLKIIRTALERYSVDHDGNYPEYILGGDASGWDTDEGCEAIIARPKYAHNLRQTNLNGGGARPPYDALLESGYLTSYPENPFMKDFAEKATEFSGGIAFKKGSGDVRFGFNGAIMGNALDDSRYLWGRYPVFDQIDKIRLQPTRLINTMSQSAWLRKFGNLHPENYINPFYSTGGVPDANAPKKILHRWWPGQFFYRSTGEMILRGDYGEENLEKADILTIWDFDIVKRDKYILGVYADRSESGLDLIRLTTVDGNVIQNRSGIIQDTYRISPSESYSLKKPVYMSPPEIFGGGGKDLAPYFPYLDENDQFIYGAPDGYPDGIMDIVYIDGNRSLFGE